MVAAVLLERDVAGACIIYIVISKLGHWQEPCPIVLLEIDKGSKVGLYGGVLPFCLAVGLGVEGGRKLPLDPKEITKQ